MKINLTTIFGFKLQLTAFFMDYKTGEFTLLGLDLIKQLESIKRE
jgi:hypothetical protein